MRAKEAQWQTRMFVAQPTRTVVSMVSFSLGCVERGQILVFLSFLKLK
jgi:hypothetical protein